MTSMEIEPAESTTAGTPATTPLRLRLFRRPPQRAFHGVLVATSLLVLWSLSYPGAQFLGLILAFWVLSAAAIVWAVRALTYTVAWRRATRTGAAWWFLVAPVGAVLITALLIARVPLRVRWEIGRSEFEQALASVQHDPEKWTGWSDRGVGTYTITHVQVVERGVIFYERTGALISNAGFAYLPQGPSADMATGAFENPQWVALGDHWYSWTASW